MHAQDSLPKFDSTGKKKPTHQLPLHINIQPENISKQNIKNFSSASSPGSPTSLTSRRYEQMNKKPLNTILGQISDFYDKRQLHEAITTFGSATDRVKMIDLVLKRRKEMKDHEDQLKLERAAPMIQNFRQNVKHKLHNELFGTSVNKFRTSCLNLMSGDEKTVTHSKPEASSRYEGTTLAPLPLGLTKDDKKLPRGSIRSSSADNPDQKNLLAIPIMNNTPKNVYQIEQSPKAGTPSSIAPGVSLTQREGNRSSFLASLEARKNSTVSAFTTHQIIEKFANIMGRNSNTRDSVSEISLKKKKSTPYLQVVRKSIRDEAQKTLEKDLYRYLIKHGRKDQDILQNFKVGQTPKLKNLESNALFRFESLQNRKAYGQQLFGKTVSLTPRK